MKSKSFDNLYGAQELDVHAVEVLDCITMMKDEEIRICRELSDFVVEKQQLQNKIRLLTDQLSHLMIKTSDKLETLEKLRKTLIETERSYDHMIESSHLLYNSALESKKQFLGEVKANEKKHVHSHRTFSKAPGW